MVCVSGISAAYALASASASWFDIVAAKAWLFFVPDQVLDLTRGFPVGLNLGFWFFFIPSGILQIVAYMMVTSIAAVVDLLYLAYNGDRNVTWSEACSSYAAFCDKIRLALILHFVALLCFFSLAIISAYRTFRDFNFPFVPTKEEAEEE